MSGSLLYPVRTGLMVALKPIVNAVVGMENVVCEFQYPLDDTEPAEVMWTQNARYEVSSASLRAGRNFLDEVGRFDIHIKTDRPVTTASQAASRVSDLAQVVIESIGDRKNNDLGIPGLNNLTVDGQGSTAETKGDQTIVGWCIVPVRYSARLT